MSNVAADLGESFNGPNRKQELKEAAKDIKNDLVDSAAQMKEHAGKMGQLAKDVTKQSLAEVQKAGERQLESVAEYARQRPLTAMLIAGAIGYLGAALLRR